MVPGQERLNRNASMTTRDELRQFADSARRSVDPGLQNDLRGQPISAGSCLHASLIFVLLLRRFGRGTARIRGGGPPTSGCLDRSGELRGHYWVDVLTSERDAFVVDVTADQFGYEQVVVMPLPESLLRYRPGPQDEVDEAFGEVVAEYRCRDLLAARYRKEPVAAARKDHLLVRTGGGMLDAMLTIATVPGDEVGPTHKKYWYELSDGRRIAFGYSRREALDLLLQCATDGGWTVFKPLN